jgi:hypothetical protein
METTTRNASLEELHQLLSVQHDAKHDAVVPASKLWYRNGQLRASGMGPDGPPGRSGLFQPTEIFDGHIADALKIPLAYVRRMSSGCGLTASPARCSPTATSGSTTST